MKLTFLGTAAAEGCPALFCNCDCCRTARERGGKNLRTRSQSLVNDDLLIDFPPDTLSHLQQNGLRGDTVETLLITHSHHDHYYSSDIRRHGGYYAYNMEKERMRVVCPEKVYNDLTELFQKVDSKIVDTLELIHAKPYEPMQLGRYRVTPMQAKHAPGEIALFYVIEDGEKTLLYAHDTGYFYDEVFEYIEKANLRFDFATFDCTYAQLPCADNKKHMGLDTVERVVDRLRRIGAVDDETRLFVNHFSHNGTPLHEEMEEKARAFGCEVSFDGCSVTF